MSERPVEVTEIHTRLLRVTLEVDPSAAYWQHADLSMSHADRAKAAIEQNWFGDRSPARVRKLIDELSSRFDPFPEGIEVLRNWTGMTEATRCLICHWHVQITDPTYRRFTGELLEELRGPEGAVITRDLVAEWLEQNVPGRWGQSTRLKFAGNLLTTAAEAGLVSRPTRERTLLTPAVPDDALGYVLHLLRDVQYEGTLDANPYMGSVALRGESLRDRLAAFPEVG